MLDKAVTKPLINAYCITSPRLALNKLGGHGRKKNVTSEWSPGGDTKPTSLCGYYLSSGLPLAEHSLQRISPIPNIDRISPSLLDRHDAPAIGRHNTLAIGIQRRGDPRGAECERRSRYLRWKRGRPLRVHGAIKSLIGMLQTQHSPIPRPDGNEVTEKVEHHVRDGKGTLISGGMSGVVERLPSGDAVKSPWQGSRAPDSRRDITTESQIYERLGPHPRLVRFINFDPEECVLTMEYMPNGCLKDYLRAHNDTIPLTQRLRWAREAAEGLQLLHAANVLHCDVEPKNFLLDADMGLKIADFSGSSLEGSLASACVGKRFLPPGFDWQGPPTVQDDLYSLGGTIYCIMTGQYPFEELPSDEVEKLYETHKFPDVTGTPWGHIVECCWRCEVSSAQEVHDFIRDMETKLLCMTTTISLRLMLMNDSDGTVLRSPCRSNQLA